MTDTKTSERWEYIRAIHARLKGVPGKPRLVDLYKCCQALQTAELDATSAPDDIMAVYSDNVPPAPSANVVTGEKLKATFWFINTICDGDCELAATLVKAANSAMGVMNAPKVDRR